MTTNRTYYPHQGEGIATRVRNTDQGSESPSRPTRDDILNEQAELYNRQNRGAPLQNYRYHEHHKPGGIATHVNSQVPSANLVGTDSRSALKDALANAHGVSRPQDFPAHQTSTVTGLGRGAGKPDDTPLFVPKLDPSPKRRLHQISEDYLQKIWKEDERKDELAQKMESNIANSPIQQLRRGGANTHHGGVSPGSRSPQLQATTGGNNNNISPSTSPRSIADLGADTDRPAHVHGCRHNPDHLKSNVPLSTEPVKPVLSGRRRVEPSPTKASVF